MGPLSTSGRDSNWMGGDSHPGEGPWFTQQIGTALGESAADATVVVRTRTWDVDVDGYLHLGEEGQTVKWSRTVWSEVNISSGVLSLKDK